VTAACCVQLAREGRYRFALLGRTAPELEPAATRGVEGEAALKKALISAAIGRGEKPAPAQINKALSALLAGREIRATLAAIQAAGSEARYLAVDAADGPGVRTALEQLRASWGPISALIHGAGVIADKKIAEKSDEAFLRVYNTKILGLRALLEAMAADPLRAILLFSSVAARAGNAGQCDYAMANEILNKVAWAEASRRPGCRVRSLGWGPWEGGMVSPELKALFEARGVPLIPLQDGALALVAELCDGREAQVELVLGGAPKAEALAGQAKAREARYEVVVDRRLALLRDHSIKGTPVIPAVFSVEWFYRAAAAFRPELHMGALRELKVLRGIPLPHLDHQAERLQLQVRELSNGEGCVLSLELRDSAGQRRYSALVDMVVAAPGPNRRPAPRLQLEAWADREIYDGTVLFHGPLFQVISGMEGVSAEGLSGTIGGLRQMGWPDQGWQTDPAALDGALQLAVLWSKHMLGGAALPTAIHRLRAHSLPLQGSVRAVLIGRSSGRERTVSDLLMLDAAGQVVVEFEGIETCRLPGQRRAEA
jgi:NADP-dependent 3-hydroxy acid dehydrogenase YdfG